MVNGTLKYPGKRTLLFKIADIAATAAASYSPLPREIAIEVSAFALVQRISSRR